MIGNKEDSKSIQPKLVSVCIPAYNHEKYIEKAIYSIIKQTYLRIELIVIDDGSTDKTFEIINNLQTECKKRFECLIIGTQHNKGRCDTLNSLVQCAKGEYIYLIASDDESMPTAIEELVNLMQSEQYVLAACDNYIIDNESNLASLDSFGNIKPFNQGKYKTFWQHLYDISPITKKPNFIFGSYESFVIGNYIPNGYLIRRSSLLATGLFTNDAPLEDLWMHLQLSKQGKYVFLNKPLFYYRKHDTNTSNDIKYMIDITNKTFIAEYNKLISSNDIEHFKIFKKK